MKRVIPVFLACLLPVAAWANPTNRSQDSGLLVDGALLASASEAARTASTLCGVPNHATAGANWGKVRVEVSYTTAGAGITAVTTTPYCKRAVDGTWSYYTTRDCSSSPCTIAQLVDSWAFPGGVQTEAWMLEYDVRGCAEFKVVVAATGSPNAGDAVDVGIVKVAGE